MIDNLELIKPFLKFYSEDDYYFLQVLQRKKDRDKIPFGLGGSNNNSRLIRSYFIKSVDHLEKCYPEIKAMCDLFHARAMINLNRRSFKGSSLQMMVQLAQSIQANNFNNSRMWNNVAGKYNPIKDKLWILDIDNTSNIPPLMCAFIDHHCSPVLVDSKIQAVIPSNSGIHLITSPFNLKEFSLQYPNTEVHKNNPTNLYIP